MRKRGLDSDAAHLQAAAAAEIWTKDRRAEQGLWNGLPLCERCQAVPDSLEHAVWWCSADQGEIFYKTRHLEARARGDQAHE